MADSKRSELDQLRQENARLIELLEAHGIAWSSGGPARAEPSPISVRPSANGPLSPQEKVALFRRLFRGRGDVWGYPDSVDRCQGSTGVSVRVLMSCCS